MSFKYKGRGIRRRLSVKDLPVTRDELTLTLKENSLDKFFIEYRGYFSNHLAEGCIALFHIGCSRAKFCAFVEQYLLQLEPANGPTRHKQDENVDLKQIKAEELKGKRCGFYKVRQHYRIELYNSHGDDLSSLLKAEFPKVALGISGAALHSLEYFGYAMSLDDHDLIIDGLAYLHHSFCPNLMTQPKDIRLLGKGQMTLFDVLRKLSDDFDLLTLLKKEQNSEWILRQKLSKTQACMMILLQKRADCLMDYLYLLKAPNEAMRSPDEFVHWLIDQMILVYLAAVIRNSLTLVHAVTSTWALAQVLAKLDGLEFKMELLRVHMCNLLALYLASGNRRLDDKLLLHPNVDRYTWERLLEIVIEMPVSTDEHVYKLTHVCYVQSMRNKDIRLGEIYKRAVWTCIESREFAK